MDEYTEQDIFRSAIDTYGAVMQITVAFEEMSELQKELCKYLRGIGSQENIAEEIADVEIMMEQMKMLFNCEADVLQVREKKVKRLKERMEQNGWIHRTRNGAYAIDAGRVQRKKRTDHHGDSLR